MSSSPALAKGASTRPFSEYLRVLDAQGVDTSALCDGLPVQLSDLRRVDHWLDWDTACTLLERVPNLLGGDNPWRVLIDAMILRPKAWKFLQLAVSPGQLYRVTAGFVAARLWPLHRGHVRVVDSTRIRIELTVPTSLRGSEDFFIAAREVYRVLPRTMGLPEARVVAEISPHHGHYDITVQASTTLVAKVRRRASLFLSPDPVSEMVEQQQVLLQSHAELSRANDELRTRQQALLREIEQRRETERELRLRDEQLQRSQKLELIGQLASGIAHDFNNLLMVTAACTELLTEYVDHPEGNALLQDLRGTVEPSGRLVAQLLTFSAGRRVRPCRLDVRQAIDAQQPMLRRITSGLDLEVILPDTAPCVLVAPAQLDQILLNLVVNARDAIEDRGTIRVELRRVDDTVVLAVSDDGPGIEPAVLERIFDPFFSTKGSGGTGLGLATVNALCQEVGAKVSVDSTLGAGTRFEVTFPSVEGEPEAAGVQDAGLVERGAGERILLVDDDTVLLRLLGTALERGGYRVFTARGLEDAQRVLDAVDSPIDVLVSDINLRGDRGPDVAKRVRARFADVPVIYLSGAEGDPEESGTWFLAKPFSPARLVDMVHGVLGGADPA
ncbi:MAG: ATP-binding protein [Nannocystaceae bacterium]|nr:ATP-binding protein [bacterium]